MYWPQHNFPSVKTIQRIRDVDHKTAKAVRAVLESRNKVAILRLMSDNSDTLRRYERYQIEDSLHALKMEYLNELIHGFGVEVLGDCNCYPPNLIAEYINLGDTYDTTILFYRGRYSVGSWGDIAEKEC